MTVAKPLLESAHPDRTKAALEAIGATSVQWIGGNPNKGLSVVAFGGWQLSIDDSYDPGYQWVMPVHLTGPTHIRLLAVWDMNHRGKGHQSARQVGACRASIPHYEEFLLGDADLIVISGDFNNSVHWDKPTEPAKFGDFMDELEARGFVSAYHSHHRSERGAEPHPTLWWMKNTDTTYHIDYTFVSRPDTVDGVTMGTHADWIAHSDHSPMSVHLRVPSRPVLAANPVVGQDQDTKDSGREGDSWLPSPLHAAIRKKQTNLVRFPIDPSTLPDISCGVNGEPFVQVFRPTYFTGEWAGDVVWKSGSGVHECSRMVRSASVSSTTAGRGLAQLAESTTPTCHVLSLIDFCFTPTRIASRTYQNSSEYITSFILQISQGCIGSACCSTTVQIQTGPRERTHLW